MISPTTLPMNYLFAVGNALLLGAGGFSVVRSLRRDLRVESALIGLAIGILGMTFHSSAINGVQQLSGVLEKEIQKLGNPQKFKDLVWQSVQAASDEPGPKGEKYQVNIPAVIEQVFRTGVWGVASSISDFFFLLAEYFIQVRRDVLLTLVHFLFPLVWGLYPAFPNLGNSIVAYVLEMSLWGPCLYLVQVIVSYIAPKYLHRPGSLGVPIVALEIIATLLILDIPRAVHQLLRGALHPSGENAALGMIFVGSRAARAASKASMSSFTQTAGPNRSPSRLPQRARRGAS